MSVLMRAHMRVRSYNSVPFDCDLVLDKLIPTHSKEVITLSEVFCASLVMLLLKIFFKTPYVAF